MRSMWRLMLSGLTIAGLVVIGPRLYTAWRYQLKIVSVAEAPRARVAIVFGAGLWRNGQPTPVLYDRIATAAELYQQGKAELLLMSGDGLTNREPRAMRQTALELGVPESAILLDDAGLDTYATCWRARALFGVEGVLLVTQNFHLPRALFICDGLGLPATGVSADRRDYRRSSVAWWDVREVFATAYAWVNLNVTKPTPP